MSYKFIILLICLSLVMPFLVAQQPATTPEKTDAKTDAEKDKAKTVAPPTSIQQAKEMFGKAYDLEQEQKFEDAIAHYNALMAFFTKGGEAQYGVYTMAVLNNMGGILSSQGKYDQAIELFKGGLKIAENLKDYRNMAQFFHKLGITFDQMARIEDKKSAMKNVVMPEGKQGAVGQQMMLTEGIYTRLTQVGDEFVVDRIQLTGRNNPFAKKRDQYTKIVNLKVKGDFDPTSLLIPDSVEFLLQIRKKGYFTISKPQSMLPEMEYTQIDEKMVAIPRQVEPRITEDFYRQGLVNPDEISLTQVEDNKLSGKPIQVTEKEKFKPGSYQLSIRKQGYDPMVETVVIYPGEGSFSFDRELKSKLRKIQYRVQSDFTALGAGQIAPDEISLNTQAVNEESLVKPAKYKLVIKEEGYEPIMKDVFIEPDERPYFINEYMKSLPREVMYQISGDYEPAEQLTPDEITLNGKFIKYGETVKPDAYRAVIRKKGYDAISEAIVIEPKNAPYILKKTLIATPRRIQHYLVAIFPAGQRLFPDICTLNGKDVLGEENLKPGEYTLNVKRSGYKPIEKQIKIPPDDTPYVIRENLDPKLRAAQLQITQEIAHDDPSITPKVTMLNEKLQESRELKHGDAVTPESYLFKIEMNGYEPEVFKDVVMPSEDPYKIVRRLIASPRAVVTKIIAEYPEGDIIVPDEITLNNKPIGKDFKIKPGTHDLVILKEGYVPIRKQIKIGANANEYLLQERLETRSRLVNVKFIDSFDRRELTPDEGTLGDQRVGPKITINLKPGTYALKSQLKGYESINENVLVPVGAEPFTIERFMKAIKRDVVSDISGDFKPDEKLLPDVFTLNDTPMGEKGSVIPGTFNLVVQKEGYFPIIEKIDIRPDPNPYILKYRLISKPRQLNILIKSSFGDMKIDPDTLILGTENVKEGQNIKPGNYALLIKKKGYNHLTDDVVVEPSEKPYLLKRTLEAMPVLAKYEIANDFNDKLIIPDVITLNDKAVDQKAAFTPGKYNMRIEKIGYSPLKKEVLIEPSDQPYVIKETMISTPREIETMITGDFPVGERVDAEVALNSKDVRDTAFKPGKYQLDILAPGYIPMKEEIVIPPAEESFHIERTLITKPRELKEKITFDVKPPEDLQPYKIILAPVDKPKAERIVKEGDQIKPNSYIMRIEKEAYEILEMKKHVWPAEAPIVFEHQLIAKQVLLKINIVYDIDPPANLDPYRVSLIDKISLIPRFVEDGKRVKPGSYFLDVQRPGYTFGPRQEIEILPSEQPYHINKKLLAKSRPISFDMYDPITNTLIPAHQIQVGGKPVSFKDTFQPGTEFDLVVKFKKYKTVEKRSKVIPGEGPFVEHVPLQQLKKYEFSIRDNTMMIDNITYNYEFYEDNNKIEEHLIDIEKGVGRIYYNIWADPNAKNLQVYAGYFFTQKQFSNLGAGIGNLNNISISRLITHLEGQSKGERGHRESLEILEKMIKKSNIRSSLKEAAITELDQLMQYIESWKDIPDSKDRVRMKMVLDALDALKKTVS